MTNTKNNWAEELVKAHPSVMAEFCRMLADYAREERTKRKCRK